MSNPNTDPNTWAANLDQSSVQIWREAMVHLRHLSDEVWRGFTLFLALNAIIVALMVAVVLSRLTGRDARLLLDLLAVAGIALTLVARYILKRNRVYYLQMLLKKSLLEAEFGFYEVKFGGTETDLAFPWRLTPEVVAELKQTPTEWVTRQIRGKGTIARLLFLIYEAWIGVYLLVLLALWIS
jgi:hypothetical protein